MNSPVRRDVLGFAHRGARAHAQENTIDAFQLACRLGATGLESDVWLTRDGVAVLDHDGVVGPLLRRKPISTLRRDQLPDHIPSLDEFYDQVGAGLPFSLDVKDPAAFEAVVSTAENAGADEQLWLCHPSWEQVAQWRSRSDAINLVDSTRIGHIKEGPEGRAAQLADAGIEAINMHRSDWTLGLRTLFVRFERACFGWDAQLRRHLDSLIEIGIDAVYSDHVERMMDAIEGRPERPSI